MNAEPDISRIAALLADPARAAMLWSLIDGTSRPAGELAFAANISAQSASGHLAKLVAGGLLLTTSAGRHRYFRIVNAEAAQLIESMASFGKSTRAKIPRPPALVRTMPSQFLLARTCYDHLAGEIAVELMQALIKLRWLTDVPDSHQLTPLGTKQLALLGVDLDQHGNQRRPFARPCIDLTQRRPHLAGHLGAALLELFVREKWILRTPHSRVINITPTGQIAFARVFKMKTSM